MASNAFSKSNPTTKPPAYCKFVPKPLPPLFPPAGPALLQGWARWTDLAVLGPLDVAMFIPLAPVAVGLNYVGEATFAGIRMILSLMQTTPPTTWTVAITVWRTDVDFESMQFPTIQTVLKFPFDTGLLTFVHVPGYDFRQAKITG